MTFSYVTYFNNSMGASMVFDFLQSSFQIAAILTQVLGVRFLDNILPEHDIKRSFALLEPNYMGNVYFCKHFLCRHDFSLGSLLLPRQRCNVFGK